MEYEYLPEQNAVAYNEILPSYKYILPEKQSDNMQRLVETDGM